MHEFFEREVRQAVHRNGIVAGSRFEHHLRDRFFSIVPMEATTERDRVLDDYIAMHKTDSIFCDSFVPVIAKEADRANVVRLSGQQMPRLDPETFEAIRTGKLVAE